METSGFVHRLISWSGAALFVSSTFALVSLCWSGVDYDHQLWTQTSTDDENVSGTTVDPVPLFRPPEIVNSERYLMLVSTMDGHMTAVNAFTGTEQWTVSLGQVPLISSSISKLEMSSGGRKRRLVPSLDGGLYQIDNEGIEPVPLAADILLSSSFKFSDDTTAVGGKDVESYGIDVNDGKVRYLCSATGCRYFDAKWKNFANFATDARVDDDILVVKRTTKTVRAVEMQTGMEKWNFSVGQHDVTFVAGLPRHQRYSDNRDKETDRITSEHTTCAARHRHGGDSVDTSATGHLESEMDEEFAEHCVVETVAEETDEENKSEKMWTQQAVTDIDLKVVIPSGHVIAVSRLHPNEIQWQQKFEAPIANIWILRNKHLSELNLFSSRVAPEVMSDNADDTVHDDSQSRFVEPLMYIGMYDDQLYIQPSVRMIREVEAVTGLSGNVDMPRVRWNPYIITAVSRTPAASPPRFLQIGSDDSENLLSTAVIPWHEQYPFDGGYYLFPDCSPGNEIKFLPINATEDSDTIDDIAVSLLNWWKEVIGISVVTSVVVNMLIFKCLGRRSLVSRLLSHSQTEDKSVKTSSDSVAVDVETTSECSKTDDTKSDNSKMSDYTSRYLTDFSQEACLGRGGFGVVFRARNQLDDCVYAVKRIALHDSDRARQKVTREVKALAKLDHAGIVRYYQSWFERPPPGWQEERDKVCIDLSLATPTGGVSPADGTASVKTPPSLPVYNMSSGCSIERLMPTSNVNPLRPMHSSHRSESSDVDVHNQCANNSDSSVGCSASNVFGSPDGDLCSKSDSFEISFRDPYNGDGSGNVIDAESSAGVLFKDTGGMSTGPPLPSVERPQRLNLQPAATTETKPAALENGGNSHDRPRKLYLYIQMQLCRPESLKDWLNDNTLNRDHHELLSMFHQIVSAIGYVHQCGLMHRDLKPSNIFFAMDGSIKIGDFGLVAAVEENCYSSQRMSTDHDGQRHTGQVGTKLYMSPEQSAGRSYTHKVDIYALGMIFFELFYPFATEMERVTTLLNVRQLDFPHRFKRELPTEAKFVRPLLSHDPDCRPSTTEILQDPIVVDFEEATQAYRRLRTHSRDRTVSSSSSNSLPDASPSTRTVDVIL